MTNNNENTDLDDFEFVWDHYEDFSNCEISVENQGLFCNLYIAQLPGLKDESESFFWSMDLPYKDVKKGELKLRPVCMGRLHDFETAKIAAIKAASSYYNNKIEVVK